MVFFLAFGLLIAGYTLVDWGHYRLAHRSASMWYLVSGKGTPPSAPVSGTQSPPSGFDAIPPSWGTSPGMEGGATP